MLRLPITIVRPLLANRNRPRVLGLAPKVGDILCGEYRMEIRTDSPKKVEPQSFPGINRVGSQICPPNIDMDYSHDLEAELRVLEKRIDSPAPTADGDSRMANRAKRDSRAASRTCSGSDGHFVY